MEKEKLNLRLFKVLRDCGRAYHLAGYALKQPGSEVSTFTVTSNALDAAVMAFAEGADIKTAKSRALDVMKGYPQSCEGFIKGAEASKLADEEKLERLVDYLYGLPDGSKKVKVWYSFPLSIRMDDEVRETEFSDVSDLVLVSEDTVTAIKFSFGSNPYSSRARKPENFPVNAPSLAAMAVGLSQKFPGKDLICEEWFFNGKDDKEIFPPFEYKPEKNIVRYSYKAGEAESVIQSLAVSAACGNCKDCGYRNLCEGIHVKEEDFREQIKKKSSHPIFTERQKQVVLHKDGPMSVLAVPGAGKTTVLVHRLAALIESGVNAANILFVTFTKKARTEIEERVKALLGEGVAMPTINTFHAFAFSVLKENPMLFGSRPKLAEDVDCKKIIRECLDESPLISGLSYNGAYLEGFGLFERMLGWFNELSKDGEECFREKHTGLNCDSIIAVYQSYRKKMKAQGYLTYDEQIARVNALFLKYPKFPKQIAEQYQYIMIDEYQDASEDQANMIYSIAKHHGNIVVVGDDDQSIYGWRGGSNQFLLNFKRDFDSATEVIMNDNFRSNNSILSAADTIITQNDDRIRKDIIGHKEARFKPAYYKNAGPEHLSALVSQLLAHYKPGDIAVIARKNKGLIEAEAALSGIVKTSSPKDVLVNDGVFKLVYAMSSLYVTDGSDEQSLFLLLCFLAGEENIPHKKNGQCLLDAVREAEPLFTLERLDTEALARYQEAVQTPLITAGTKLLKALKKMQYFHGFGKLFQDFSDIFDVPANHSAFLKLAEDADLRGISRLSDFHEFLSDLILFGDSRSIEYEHTEDEVTLITAHGSKGMEFPVVLIYDIGEFDLSPEGKRLLYVGMTRAKNTLLMLEKPYSKTEELLSYLEGKIAVRQ